MAETIYIIAPEREVVAVSQSGARIAVGVPGLPGPPGPAGGSAIVAEAAPQSASPGALWFNPVTGRLSVLESGQWRDSAAVIVSTLHW